LSRALIALLLACLAASGNARADTAITLLRSFAGNVNVVGTQKTLRTLPNSSTNSADACALVSGATTAGGSTSGSATLSGIPNGATILAAYLYWAGSSSTPDYTVTFENSPITATRQYTSATSGGGFNYFAGAVDVTSAVISKRNGTYSFAGLTVENGSPYCASEAVLGGWALMAIYSDTGETFRVLNVYEGLQYVQNSSVTLGLSNFQIPNPIGSATGRIAHLTWEGDPTLSGGGENLTFNGVTLSDASNPSGNQFNSVSTINGDAASYGVDFDTYSIVSPTIQSGQTSASTVYTSGQDLVLLNMEVVAVPNVPVADVAITNTTSSTFSRGAPVSYTLSVTNNGPNNETGTVTVTDTLPATLSGISISASGWNCAASSGQTVSCFITGLANGVTANTITINATVSSSATGTITNSATVAHAMFDNVASNNTASVSNAVAAVDLSLTMTRNGSLITGQSASYTLALSNVGTASEPGPITLTDTLPSGMTYTSAVGTLWTCSASGQAVTCTRTGALASGASTDNITLTVLVAANASGTLTNTATVAGTGYEAVSANNTATDSFTIASSVLYAYYKMDESSWNGSASEIKDASGNNRHGVAVGATTVVSSNPTPTCRAASISSNSAIGTQSAAQVPVRPEDVGLNGTIAFWFRADSSAWNSAARTMFDATHDSVGDYAFHTIITATGALQFSLTDSNNSTFSTTTSANTYAANTWHHIAVTWHVAGGNNGTKTFIYVDGVQAAAGSFHSSGLWPSTASTANGNLYFGDTNSASVVPYAGTGNSANGDIDEVYIYAGALSATEVTQLMTSSHSCVGSVDHYELSVPSLSVNCLPTTVTVSACSDAVSPCVNKYTSPTTTTAVLTASAGSTVASPGVTSTTVTFVNGVATTTFNNLTGGVASVTLSGEQTAAANSRQCCPDGASCTVANSCSSTFNQSGLIFSASASGPVTNIANLQAGTTSATYYLRAVKSDLITKACESALSGNRNVDFAYECVLPSSCPGGQLMTLTDKTGGGATIIGPSTSTYVPASMTFDANGNAPFTFKYKDVGKILLRARATTANGAALAGVSNSFVSWPASFTWGTITYGATLNPAAADKNGLKFAKAGDTFTASVSAVDAEGSVTPSFGNEGETIAFDAPTAGATGTNTLPSVSLGTITYSAGTASIPMSWPEVGIIKLVPHLASASYLGTGTAVIGAASANIGRFYPDHFAITNKSIVPRNSTCSSTFSYMSEPFAVKFTLTAQSKGNATTSNYAEGAFAKLTGTGTWSNTVAATNKIDLRLMATHFKPLATGAATCSVAFDNAASGTPSSFRTRFSCDAGATVSDVLSSVSRVSISSDSAPAFAAGVADMSANVALLRASTPDGPYDTANTAALDASTSSWLKVGIAPQDSDSVALVAGDLTLDADLDSTVDHALVGTTGVRYGRLVIPNAYGSELLSMPLDMRAQYWSYGAYVPSSDDSCTPLAAANFTVTDRVVSVHVATTPQNSGPTLINGSSNGLFRLSQPTGLAVKASAYISTSTTSPTAAPLNSYLPGNALVTFGTYKAGPVIFIRESF
jgi:MSHA biogenesis protein MshQ